MATPTREQLMGFKARRRALQIATGVSAKVVRRELLRCLSEGDLPTLSGIDVRQARMAAAKGEFPSHQTLLLVFEDAL